LKSQVTFVTKLKDINHNEYLLSHPFVAKSAKLISVPLERIAKIYVDFEFSMLVCSLVLFLIWMGSALRMFVYFFHPHAFLPKAKKQRNGLKWWL